MSTPADSNLQRQSQATAWVQTEPRVRIADGRQRPVERTLGTPAVAAMLDREAAGEGVKTIRRPLGNAQRKGRSSLPLCVGCLYAIGWGQKRIIRHTGFAKTSVHRFSKLHGLTDADTAARKKRAEDERRKRAGFPGGRKEWNKMWRKSPAGVAYRKRRDADPKRKIVLNLRRRLREYVRRSGYRSLDLIGCSASFLRSHIQEQFTDGMSWANYGDWHIDHIIPCAVFDLTNAAQARDCFNYRNLQPLWAADNLAKSDSLPTPGNYYL